VATIHRREQGNFSDVNGAEEKRLRMPDPLRLEILDLFQKGGREDRDLARGVRLKSRLPATTRTK
jgi:hypothetical protein